MTATAFDLHIAARTLFGEARGEGEAGQRAVAHVFVNRMRDKNGRWGSTLASVCLWRDQFSCWRSSDPNFQVLCALADDAQTLVTFKGFIQDALDDEPDPTKGATHYFAISMLKPPFWEKDATFNAQIGHHKFYSNVA